MITTVAPPGQPGSLELADIQGNILTAYGKEGFPKGRNLLINVTDAEAGRTLIRTLLPLVTTAVRWSSHNYGHFGKVMVERPKVTLNLAFTFWGLIALGVPVRLLDCFPDEFIQGMALRAMILGDAPFGRRVTSEWDPVWQHEDDPTSVEDGKSAHVLITLNSQMDPATGEPVPELEAMTTMIRDLCAGSGGKLTVMVGHCRDGTDDCQDLSALLAQQDGGFVPTAKEHFGFTDAISDPVFDGQFPLDLQQDRVCGNGKLVGGKWAPLATGEFLLGYPDEAQEIPISGMFRSFGRNGTFIAYRKLQQNVVAFRRWVDETAPQFGAVFHIADPVAARETLMAKIAGRWSDGAPLALFPDFASWVASTTPDPTSGIMARRELSNYTFFDDPIGRKCPITSHTRRANPRDTNGPESSDGTKPSNSGTVLTDRRRLLRRGIPYGECLPDAADEGEHGIIILIVCASLSRQFEFMQQQWVNYGVDANAGNDTDPLIGLRGAKAKYIIPADPALGRAPFIAAPLPQFVETRGGAYFFVPSMSALQMLSLGVIDPT